MSPLRALCLPITVYQDNASNTHDRIMLVFMNPSNKSDEDWLDESAEQARDGFINWLTENACFYIRFLRIMQDYIPDTYRFKDRKFNLDLDSSEKAVNEYMDYIKTDFFHDFYVTDYVKIRLSTSEMRRSLSLKDNILKLSSKELREKKNKVQPRARLDLDAMREKFEVDSEPVRSVFQTAYERVLELRSELLREARVAKGNVKAKLYGEAVKIDVKILDRLIDPALMVSSDGGQRFDIGKLVLEWIAETYGVDGLRDFMEHMDSISQSIASKPDYR